ncbi:hypothetical protein [Actinomycetospora aeridis]|uniref:NACHT domain-containing protein n=1 Tax=Actinomycetospora aeridis TaxID=3129231 RepID=A0ABU8N7P4_9PSEU
MGEDHPLPRSVVERDPAMVRRLAAFTEEAKRAVEGSTLERVYATFDSLEELALAATESLAELRLLLDATVVAPAPVASGRNQGPSAPDLYAVPSYAGMHHFVGRRDQLSALDDWAGAAGDPLMLFEAIGGAGKSMLTWQWTTTEACRVRTDWAGRFWYSFYEKGAVMADFCRHALAYTTGTPIAELDGLPQSELSDRLLRVLASRPWLLVLDGLERILVAYHRDDAAALGDEQEATDRVAERDPCDAIRIGDEDLLRALTTATPSKILVTSRLSPRVLLNAADQPIPGARRERLPGLDPVDAEALLRSCGVEGDSDAIRDYLRRYCDNHPLVIGVIGGLVAVDYLQDRGNFDAWAADPDHGADLDLAGLDLVGRRNHILRSAITSLSGPSARLLSTLALLPESIDFTTMSALNPHLPDPPQYADPPFLTTAPPQPRFGDIDVRNLATEQLFERRPGEPSWRKARLTPEESEHLETRRREFDDKVAAWQRELEEQHAEWQHERDKQHAEWQRARDRQYGDHLRAKVDWESGTVRKTANRKLAGTVKDLERRGLLQYDRSRRCYDLHPVVRAVAVRGLDSESLDVLGERVVDHFSSVAHDPYDQVRSIDDLRDALTVLRVHLRRRDYARALSLWQSGPSNAMKFNLEAHTEALAFLREFFVVPWSEPVPPLGEFQIAYVANDAAICLGRAGQTAPAVMAAELALRSALKRGYPLYVLIALSNAFHALEADGRLARAERCAVLALELATLNSTGAVRDREQLFIARVNWFKLLVGRGRTREAEAVWATLDALESPRKRSTYRPGTAEVWHAKLEAQQGTLSLATIDRTLEIARSASNRRMVRELHVLKARHHASTNPRLAAENYAEAVRMSRETGFPDARSETMLVLTRLELGEVADPHAEAHRLAGARTTDDLALARLWHALDEPRRATNHALAAYRTAWADGEPHVHRQDLDDATALLRDLEVPLPRLPVRDLDAEPEPSWESDVRALIGRLRPASR